MYDNNHFFVKKWPSFYQRPENVSKAVVQILQIWQTKVFKGLFPQDTELLKSKFIEMSALILQLLPENKIMIFFYFLALFRQIDMVAI